MSDNNPIIEDSIYEWPLLRFLNRLAYLKDKAQMEEHIQRINMLNNGK